MPAGSGSTPAARAQSPRVPTRRRSGCVRFALGADSSVRMPTRRLRMGAERLRMGAERLRTRRRALRRLRSAVHRCALTRAWLGSSGVTSLGAWWPLRLGALWPEGAGLGLLEDVVVADAAPVDVWLVGAQLVAVLEDCASAGAQVMSYTAAGPARWTRSRGSNRPPRRPARKSVSMALAAARCSGLRRRNSRSKRAVRS